MQGQADRSTAVGPSHSFLEHTGEVRLHVEAPSLAELFAYRGYARKIYDGAQANTPGWP